MDKLNLFFLSKVYSSNYVFFFTYFYPEIWIWLLDGLFSRLNYSLNSSATLFISIDAFYLFFSVFFVANFLNWMLLYFSSWINLNSSSTILSFYIFGKISRSLLYFPPLKIGTNLGTNLTKWLIFWMVVFPSSISFYYNRNLSKNCKLFVSSEFSI